MGANVVVVFKIVVQYYTGYDYRILVHKVLQVPTRTHAYTRAHIFN